MLLEHFDEMHFRNRRRRPFRVWEHGIKRAAD